MPNEPINITTDILIAIREDIASFRTSVEERFNEVDKRFNDVDERFNDVAERFNEVDERFNEVDERFDRVEGRLDRLEKLGRKYRRDAAAMMVIIQATAGDFDERVSAVEERIVAVEAAKS